MKFLRKINRGLILTTLIIVAIVIYLVSLSSAQAKVKPEIQDICEKYINIATSYKQLPQEYRKENTAIPKAELDKYLEDMTSDIKAFYIDNEQSYKYVVKNIKADLESQASGKGLVFSYKKEIQEYKNFTFDGNTVTVTILSNAVYDGPNIFVPGLTRENISAQTTDTITLQKIDGDWKIVYADLPQPMPSQNGTMTYTRNVGF